MSPVLDKVDVTSLGKTSDRHTSSVSLVGAPHWINTFGGAVATEASPAQAVISENGYRAISRDIHCTVEQTETGFIAAEPVTGVFGFGRDLNEALHDLFFALHEHRDVLERQGSLSVGLQEQLAYLNALL
jgi:hypothetical protein